MNIRFYVTKKDHQATANLYLMTMCNSKFVRNEGKWFFNSVYSGLEELKITYSIVKFNESLADLCMRLIRLGHAKAASITKENVGPLMGGKVISQITHSLVNKYSYYEDQLDIFDFVSEFLIRVLNGHLFENGNKRTAIIATRSLLHEFGYYLKWSSDSTEEYIEKYRDKLMELTSLAESKNENGELLAIVQAKEWIMSHVVIAIINRKG